MNLCVMLMWSDTPTKSSYCTCSLFRKRKAVELEAEYSYTASVPPRLKFWVETLIGWDTLGKNPVFQKI